MKLLVVWIIFTSSILAADIKLSDGRVFVNATIKSASYDKVMIMHSGGLSSVSKELLPPDLKAKYASPRPTGISDRIYPESERSKQQAEVMAAMSKKMTIPFTVPAALPIDSGGKEVTISGQCFVATKGGTNYKLGDVRVCVYPSEALKSYLIELRKQDAPESTEDMRLMTLANSVGKPDVGLFFISRSISRSQLMFSFLPQAPFSTRTDADGRYTLTHNLKQPYTIFAYAKRQVSGNDEEFYRWEIPHDEIDDLSHFNLTNSNML